MAPKYFKAGPKLEAKLRVVREDTHRNYAAALKLAKSCGAYELVTRGGQLTGFSFKKPPDPELWSPIPEVTYGYKPLRRKPNNPLRKAMAEFNLDMEGPIKDACTLKTRIIGDGGLRLASIGWCFTPKAVYLASWGYDTIPGATRITDLEWEKAIKETKKAKRKKVTA
jgi:hypothetical protein